MKIMGVGRQLPRSYSCTNATIRQLENPGPIAFPGWANRDSLLARHAETVAWPHTVEAVHILRRTLRRLGLAPDPVETEARRIAREAFSAEYPDLEIEELRRRAIEPDRYVFAVIIRPKTMYRGMPPYRLFEVARSLSCARELPRDPDSPYVLRGIK